MATSSAATVKDPVCGMSVDPLKTAYKAVHAGQTHVFCSAGCRTKFLDEPAKYIRTEKRRASTLPAGTIYTCPMHLQIRQEGPGSCPICGMALILLRHK